MSARTSDNGQCRLGVLAFGDSITNGGGERQWGLAVHSWALWVARALGLPYTSYAIDGAYVGNVLEEQIPAFERQTADPHGRYDLGCLYIGANDVHAPEWEVTTYEHQLRGALEFLRARCERILTLTAPVSLGRPPAQRNIHELNDAVERVAADVGALLVDLRTFNGRNLVMSDQVHPTALGQIAIAERALAVLEQSGMRVAVRPSSLVAVETTRWSRLRADLTYLYRYAKDSAGALALGGLARAQESLRSSAR